MYGQPFAAERACKKNVLRGAGGGIDDQTLVTTRSGDRKTRDDILYNYTMIVDGRLKGKA